MRMHMEELQKRIEKAELAAGKESLCLTETVYSDESTQEEKPSRVRTIKFVSKKKIKKVRLLIFIFDCYSKVSFTQWNFNADF